MSFDFQKFADAVTSNEARLEVDQLRGIYNEMKIKQAQSEANKKKTIDWAVYEKNIQRPGLVQAFKEAHASIPPMKFESGALADLESGFAKLIKEADAAALSSEKAIAELQAQLADLNAESDWDNMTFEKELAANPAIKREIAAELEQHKWFTV